MIKASVIVPAYNAQKTISRSIEALLRQTFPQANYEVIIIDDGSTDKTAEIAVNYPVRYYRKENGGPASARNMGVRKAVGEIILFTDSDCVASKTWIEQMLRPFNDPTVMAVKGAYRSNQQQLTARFSQLEFEERFEMLSKSESIDMVDTYAAAFRKTVFVGAGGFDESFPVANNEDTDLSYRLSVAGHKMVFNPDAIVYHLNHPASLKRYGRIKFLRGYWRMVVYKRYPGKMIKDTYTPQSLKLQILALIGCMALLALSAFIHEALYALLILLMVFLLSTAGFTRFALNKDTTVGMLSPFFIALRASSIGLGVLFYFICGAKCRSFLHK
ncbi:MAG: glycosyltransferase [Candidatus Magnetominusculus sp. LBB02]|nr:glycosyltransferase [Candidatus Magnetominusculus sp. LBB02]